MSGLFRNGPKPVVNVLGGIRIQTSLQGLPTPIVYGRTRIGGNLVWYGDFIAKPVTAGGKKGSGGGGSGKKGGGEYDYGAAIIIGLCQGPINALGAVWSTQGNLPVNQTSETYTVAGGGGSYTVTQEPTYLSDFGVTRGDAYSVTANDFGAPSSITLTGTQQTPMTVGGPTTGQYTRSGANGATYNFAAGDAGKTMTITYTYAPPITSGGTAQDPITTVGFTFFDGALGQSVWSYLTSSHPSQAIPYSGLAYVATPEFDLGMSGTLPNLNFEVYGFLPFGSGQGDSNPSDVLYDLLTNNIYGCGIDPSQIGSMTNYSDYCVANGLLISPALDQVRTAADWIKDILDATNAEIIETGGQLVVASYGDTTVVANGATFQPQTNPVYDLDSTDFIRQGTAPAVQVERPTVQDAYNAVRIEYLDRGNSYNPSIVESDDLQAIDAYKYRPEGTRQYHMFTTQTPAALCAATILSRLVYIRNTFKFKLQQKYILLDPMDLVTITVPELGYNQQPVRITAIDEQSDRTLDIQAEDFPWGCSGPTLYTKQSQTPGGPNAYAPPGSVNPPIIFEALSRLNNQIGHTVWFGLSGKGTLSTSEQYADPFSAASLSGTWGTQDNTMVVNASTDVEAGTAGGARNSNYYNLPINSDQSSQGTLTAVGGVGQDTVGVSVRMSASADTYYRFLVGPHGFTLDLDKVVAGTVTSLAQSTASVNIGDVIKIQIVGNLITCYQNGVAIMTATDTSIATGFPGIAGTKASSGTAPMRLNNWVGGTMIGNPNWGGCRIWVSLDGLTYQQAATCIGPTKMGKLMAALASNPDPDTTDTIAVNVGESLATLQSYTAAETNVFTSTCYIGSGGSGELIAYETATLGAAYNYSLGTLLRRGVYGSTISSHNADDDFMLLDETVEGWDYDVELIGTTVHFKFTSFNQSGLVEENIADVVDYTYTITGASIGLLTPAHASYRPTSNPLTGHDAGASATINIASFSMRVPGQADIPFGSGAITGKSFNTLYYVYFADPGFLPIPSPTYLASTVKTDAIDSAGFMFVGSILTPVSGGPDTTGNNDGGGGAQIGNLNILNMADQNLGAIAGNGAVTNPQNALDSDLTTYASLTVSGDGNVNDANFELKGISGITRNYSSAKIRVLLSVPTNSLAGATVPTAAAITYSTDAYATSNILLLGVPNGTTVAEQWVEATLPFGQNMSQVESIISVSTVGSGGNATSGSLELRIYAIRIEAIE